jgi:glycosyltransferase involved in cell wall biosynthesis
VNIYHYEKTIQRPRVSICICTHAPDIPKLQRVINALSKQTLEPALWEVLLIENTEHQTLGESILSSLPCSYYLLQEPRQGKVNAMAAAARQICGDWVVFVDDDNLLAPDYLENLVALDHKFPQIGVFSASISGDFEVSVPEWAKHYLVYLAVREVEQPRWANCSPAPVGPVGAGMCVRVGLYREFAKLVLNGSISSGLGRTSGSLTAGTDDTVFMDIAFRSGYGCGDFPELKLVHIISACRLELSYIKRLVRDITYSHTLLAAPRRGRKIGLLRPALKFVFDHFLSYSEPSREIRSIRRARAEGLWRAKVRIWKQQ